MEEKERMLASLVGAAASQAQIKRLLALAEGDVEYAANLFYDGGQVGEEGSEGVASGGASAEVERTVIIDDDDHTDSNQPNSSQPEADAPQSQAPEPHEAQDSQQQDAAQGGAISFMKQLAMEREERESKRRKTEDATQPSSIAVTNAAEESISAKCGASETGACQAPDRFGVKVLTYNVWFEMSVRVEERMAGLGRIIRAEQPDIVVMQEVTPQIQMLFTLSSWYEDYEVSETPLMAYYTLLFTRKASVINLKPIVRHEFSDSQMGRDIVYAECKIGGKHLIVATSHLESPTEFKAGPAKNLQIETRKRQLLQALRMLEKLAARSSSRPEIIYAGDMNWNDAECGEPELSGGWKDLWRVLYPKDPGYTYDGPRNHMLVNKFKGRLDRVFGWLDALKAEYIRMLGTDKIEGVTYVKKVGSKELTLPVCVSDHFGLLTQLRLKEDLDTSETIGGSGLNPETAPSRNQGTISNFFKRKT